MGVPIALTVECDRPTGRRQEAYDFIRSYIVRHGHSPSIENIRLALGVSKTRAKALVHQLAAVKAIERVPGAQRGISIPGLARELVLEELRREGLIVSAGEPCPQGHLPLIAILAQIPDKSAGEHHDGSECGGAARL
ncbi:SOS-response transcriptional repressor LexA [Sphingomonas endophytica]|uniref:SOS-response transcriptional repressor LexA n=1 Tax=Sphingomonas endophytica TaxID=869719 RepID=A0ABR6N979_9SPHN|nr:hypothetical protein [Sphingomonas endophytica]MBB5727328.1 SOS-response transcriptional repressor LexA [Sphingomonas endophytica]